MTNSDISQDYLDIPEGEQEDFYSDDDLFQIQSWGADLSFRELITRYDENELVKPELQRHYVWDKSEASRFIDSLLLGLPVPSIFLAKTQTEKLLIIDGFQRLMTVRDYVKGIFSKDGKIFRLSRSDKIHERWRGKAFAELDDEEQRRIRNTTIHAIIFTQRKPASGDTSLFQVFERINSSGRTLLAQEIRNCVYQGPFNSLLLELNEHPVWRDLFGKQTRDDRMRDVEFILRFLALSSDEILYSGSAPSRISLKKYLNQFMDKFNHEEHMEAFRLRFISAIEMAHDYLGENAFHNISPTDPSHVIPRFSPTVFDSILTAFSIAIAKEVTLPPTPILQTRKIDLLKDEDYQDLLARETMRVPNIRARIFGAYNALFEGELP
jgi:hypothetical protein